MSVGVEGDYDKVTLREIAEQQLSTRFSGRLASRRSRWAAG